MVEEIFKSFDFAKIFWVNAPYSIAKVAKSGKIIDCNDTLANLLGYRMDELCKYTFDHFSQPDDLVFDRELFNQLVNSKINYYTLKKRYITRSGIMFQAQCFVYGMYKHDDRFDYAIAIIMPVSTYGSSFWSYIAKDWRKAKKVIWGILGGVAIYLVKKLFGIDISQLISPQ
jgi:PAS domain S-box-containing protein